MLFENFNYFSQQPDDTLKIFSSEKKPYMSQALRNFLFLTSLVIRGICMKKKKGALFM